MEDNDFDLIDKDPADEEGALDDLRELEDMAEREIEKAA
jgi:hypothetical protein